MEGWTRKKWQERIRSQAVREVPTDQVDLPVQGTLHLSPGYVVSFRLEVYFSETKEQASQASPGDHFEMIWRGGPEKNGRNGSAPKLSQRSPRTRLTHLCRAFCTWHLGMLYASDWKFIFQKLRNRPVRLPQGTILKGFGGVDQKKMAGTDPQPSCQRSPHGPG